MKIPFDEIEAIIRESLEPSKAQEILKKIEIVSEELKNDGPKLPKKKNQFAIIALDLEGRIPDDLELTGLIIKMPETEDVGLTLTKISEAAREQNAAKKKRGKMDIASVSEAAYAVKRKWLKEKNIAILTREPVRIIKSNNKLV